MARVSKVKKSLINTDISSVTLLIPRVLHEQAKLVASSKGEDIGNLMMETVAKALEKYVAENHIIESLKVTNQDNLLQYSLFNDDEEDLGVNKTLLPSSKDIGASRLMIEDDETSKVTYGQFWNAYEKKLAPFMGDKDSSAKTKQWMGALVKKYGTTDVMNVMMRLDGLAMMPVDPVAWIAKILTTVSADEAYKRNHGGTRGTSGSHSSGGMVNI